MSFTRCFALFVVLALAVACMALEPKPVKLDDANGAGAALKVQMRMLKQAISKAKGAEKRTAEKDLETLDSLQSLEKNQG